MARKDIIVMTQKELRKLNVAHKIIDKRISMKDGSEKLALSYRQVKRIVSRIRNQGDMGIIHVARGRISNNKFSKELYNRVITLYQDKYYDFNLVHACEKLSENHKIKISNQTLSNWLDAENISRKRKRSRKHRSWRERMHHPGELVQMDGSHHDWFEGRRDRCCLMGYIDDANNKVYMRFYEYEGTFPAMDSFRRFIRKNDLPIAVYCDKHTTYKSPKEPTVEEQLNGKVSKSQFQRALEELGVNPIFAHSAQAKGRIERLFETVQDRLVKELRLNNISSIDAANKFLDNEYLAKYNKQFCVKPIKEDSFYQKLLPGVNLNRILCIKIKRNIYNDFTVRYNNNLYQIVNKTNAKKVVIEIDTKERLRIDHNGNTLQYKMIIKRNPVVANKDLTKKRKKLAYKPAKTHLWKRVQAYERLKSMRKVLEGQKIGAPEEEMIIT